MIHIFVLSIRVHTILTSHISWQVSITTGNIFCKEHWARQKSRTSTIFSTQRHTIVQQKWPYSASSSWRVVHSVFNISPICWQYTTFTHVKYQILPLYHKVVALYVVRWCKSVKVDVLSLTTYYKSDNVITSAKNSSICGGFYVLYMTPVRWGELSTWLILMRNSIVKERWN